MVKVSKDWVSVARVGRSFGFRGHVFLNLLTDFPESFEVGNVYHLQFRDLILESYSPQKSVAKFKEINSKEEARQIVNCVLYSTQEESRKSCSLEDGMFFWFDIIGSQIVENGESLGIVSAIDRFCSQDYLYITTDFALLVHGFPKSFLIPYNARYILHVESPIAGPKIIYTQFCKDILENS